MKKKKSTAVCVALAMLISCVALITGCGGGEDQTPKEYVIQYADGSGVHTITVTGGMPYSLDVVPTKTGYDFMGLYDAEVGGKQYVSSTGSSLEPYAEKKNVVLFPQFRAKNYTVILDHQGAPVGADRQFTVAYDSSLPELPKNLEVEHKEFAGWYTEPECGGTQVADKYGLLPLASILNEQNFDLSSSIVTLYAGFEAEKHTVTFYFEEGMEAEEISVAYDTPIARVVPETRVNGNAVLTWSKTRGGEVFNGKITADMDLYALEYAPVIEFDSNGGNDVSPIVARAGSTVALPAPTKDMAKFVYWEDMSGDPYTSTAMPSKSMTLKAVWQAKLVFDSNGGTDVDDISVAAGNKIFLPMPEREGFVFAGWYTADKEQYTSTTMPAAGIALKAGWYKEKSKNTVVISSSSKVSSKTNTASINSACFKLNYADYATDKKVIIIRIKGHFKIKSSYAELYGNITACLEVYSQMSISSSYLIAKKAFNGVTGEYRDYDFDMKFAIGDDAYLCFYHKISPVTYSFQISDFYYVVDYPDTGNLYL